MKPKTNGIQNEFIIDFVSPVTIMPLYEQIVNQTEIQKKNKPLSRCHQKRSGIPGENTGKHGKRK